MYFDVFWDLGFLRIRLPLWDQKSCLTREKVIASQTAKDSGNLELPLADTVADVRQM